MTSPSTPYYSTGHVILNIGLNRNDINLPINPTFVEDYLRFIGLKVREFKIFVSNTEPTAVVVLHYRNTEAETPAVLAAIDTAAQFLKQDAIAVFSPESKFGFLTGPKAAAWSPFNPHFFLMPDGLRLSQHLNQGTAL